MAPATVALALILGNVPSCVSRPPSLPSLPMVRPSGASTRVQVGVAVNVDDAWPEGTSPAIIREGTSATVTAAALTDSAKVVDFVSVPRVAVAVTV